LIRRDITGVPHFLMLKSDRWNSAGAWWFVGGTEEEQDNGSLEKTVRREMREEMCLVDEDILEIKSLKSVKDLRISKRLGVYTDFEYQIFSVQLSQTSDRVRQFFSPAPKVTVYYAKATREHEFGWLKWDELLQNADLIQDAQPII